MKTLKKQLRDVIAGASSHEMEVGGLRSTAKARYRTPACAPMLEEALGVFCDELGIFEKMTVVAQRALLIVLESINDYRRI